MSLPLCVWSKNHPAPPSLVKVARQWAQGFSPSGEKKHRGPVYYSYLQKYTWLKEPEAAVKRRRCRTISLVGLLFGVKGACLSGACCQRTLPKLTLTFVIKCCDNLCVYARTGCFCFVFVFFIFKDCGTVLDLGVVLDCVLTNGCVHWPWLWYSFGFRSSFRLCAN